VKYLESLNTRKLATHISEHGSIYTPDVVYGVLEKFRSCLLEMLLNSKKVKIEGLGTFYTTLECKKGGALTKDKFNINSNIDGLHIRFLPEQEQEQNISSRQFLKQAEFINVDSLLKKEDENGGGSGSGSGSGSQNSGSEQNGGSGNSGEQNGGSQAETVAAPTISGETPFDESTQVTISGPEGAEIRYTVDGSTPTAESSLYSEALTLTDTVLVKAIAIKNGVSSEVASKTFTKNGSGNNGGGFDTGS
jgi:predicted histone-like DNA-binding protein